MSRAIERELWSLVTLLVVGVAVAAVQNPWQYNSPQYDSAQYAKLISANGDPTDNAKWGPFQYQYVDYMPTCMPGGQPVCATNGNAFFYFENDCKLESHNMKLLFQQGTELEPTDLERCLPNCNNIKCTERFAPVCATVSGPGAGRGQQGVTFNNECEVRRRECESKQTLRILHSGACQHKSKGKGRKKQRRNRTTSTTTTTTTTTEATTKSSTERARVYIMLQTAPPVVSTTAAPPMEVATAATTETTPAPMKFRPVFNVASPDVSISRAINSYSVYNIADVGNDYGAIADTSLSMFVPGVGTVTDVPPKTTTKKTSTTTITPTPTPKTSSSTAKAAPKKSDTATTSTTSTTEKSSATTEPASSSTTAKAIASTNAP